MLGATSWPLVGDVRLFRFSKGSVEELEPSSVPVERVLQRLIEQHAETILGITILASEYPTGKLHRGRIDSLGLDENRCPVILEYKRTSNENVINQGLFYLNWLLDHKAEFEALVRGRMGDEAARGIEWDAPRLLCIANDFSRYDEHAVREIDRSIELLRYRRYDEELLLLELLNPDLEREAPVAPVEASTVRPATRPSAPKTAEDVLAKGPGSLRELYEALKTYVLSLGDDVEVKGLKPYIAFRRLKNFASVVPMVDAPKLLVVVKVNPDTVPLSEGFTRDVRKIGHWGTGDLEITIRTMSDLDRARPLIEASYQAN